jgi:hypothetical protein
MGWSRTWKTDGHGARNVDRFQVAPDTFFLAVPLPTATLPVSLFLWEIEPEQDIIKRGLRIGFGRQRLRC